LTWLWQIAASGRLRIHKTVEFTEFTVPLTASDPVPRIRTAALFQSEC
jgi:hypothetical protein